MKTIQSTNEYYSIIQNSKLFENIDPSQYEQVFHCLHASFRQYEKDEYIQQLANPFNYSGIVLDGIVEGSFISEDYNKINMNHFPKGKSFGEALACVNSPHSPIQLKALTNCTVVLFDLKQIFLKDFENQLILSKNLISILATQNVFSNLKLRITSQKSLRDRILMYFTSLVPDTEGYIHIPFTKTALAEFLGVNRSALSRELGKMQDDQILYLDGKKAKLL